LCKKKRIGKQAQNCNAKEEQPRNSVERERERERRTRIIGGDTKLKKLDR
jgi:hypothetical protein